MSPNEERSTRMYKGISHVSLNDYFSFGVSDQSLDCMACRVQSKVSDWYE
jgi:hypothetical protein